jgi:hypothetical protein
MNRLITVSLAVVFSLFVFIVAAEAFQQVRKLNITGGGL